MIYQVLKDFPSMRGGTEYKKGETVRLEMNGRTKALVELGYIKKPASEPIGVEDIAQAIYANRKVEGVKVKECKPGCFKVWVKEADETL